jgi:hypothetical protein
MKLATIQICHAVIEHSKVLCFISTINLARFVVFSIDLYNSYGGQVILIYSTICLSLTIIFVYYGLCDLMTPLEKGQTREEGRMWGFGLRPNPHIYPSLRLEGSFFSVLI